MRKLSNLSTLLTAGLVIAVPLISSADDNEVTSLAVYGDAPYSCKAGECPAGYSPDTPDANNPSDRRQIDATPAFIDAINHDSKVRTVLFVGDIHSGANYCTLAYNQIVYNLWSQFKDPLVYTPGDNEWTDCQKAAEGGGVKNSAGDYVDYAAGHPVANLALVRSMFFPEPGVTLGQRPMRVTSQREAFDPSHPTDAEYVENVMWMRAGVMFVTVNIPGGSNNDDDLWNTGAFGSVRSAPQIEEVAQRTAADLRWLDAAFAQAKALHANAVVITEQADMWDLDGKAMSHIVNYEPFINKIATLTVDFAKPVLLINGDSHTYRSDNPLANDAPCAIETGVGTATAACANDAHDSHASYATGNVSNFHRLVVHGSTFPLEYTRLTVNPRAAFPGDATSFGPFTWERVIP